MSEITVPPVTFVPVESMRVDGQNPNRMTEKQTDALCESINKYGFIVPIITNKDLLVADGEQRLQAAQKLSMKSVPIIRLNISDVDRRILRQVLNKLRGEHELLADAREFDLIVKAGQEDDLKNLLLLKDAEIERYLREIREPKEETYEIPEIEKIQTDIKRGDVYQLGAHRLMCGDATIQEDYNVLLGADKPRMIFTDPPYGVGYNKHHLATEHSPYTKKAMFKAKKGSAGFKNWGDVEGDKSLGTYYKFIEMMAQLNSETSWYLCAPSRHFGSILNKLDEQQVYRATSIVWVKEHFVPSWERYHAKHEFIIFCGDGAHPTGKKSIWYGPTNETTVWQIKRDNRNPCNLHPTQKPVEMPLRAIINSSVQNDIVYDGFGGSGSTLIACEQTGRRCFMMEIDPRYCQVIINRWEKYIGKKAVKLKETERNDITKTAVSA